MVKKQLLMAAAASALLLGISTVNAADIESAPAPETPTWYVSLFGGVSWLDEVKTEYTYGGTPVYDHDVETDTGFIVGGAIGTHLMEDLRVELEVAYSENDADVINYGPYSPSENDAFGSFQILTFMANLWYDVPLSETLNPYIGGGAGIAIVDGKSGYAPDQGDDTAFDSSEVEFAFQVGAGLRWHAFENIAFDVGYRLRGIDGPSFDGGTFEQSSDYDANWMWSHNVIAGVSLGF